MNLNQAELDGLAYLESVLATKRAQLKRAQTGFYWLGALAAEAFEVESRIARIKGITIEQLRKESSHEA